MAPRRDADRYGLPISCTSPSPARSAGASSSRTARGSRPRRRTAGRDPCSPWKPGSSCTARYSCRSSSPLVLGGDGDGERKRANGGNDDSHGSSPLWESASLAGKQGQPLFFPAVELLLGEVFAEPLVRGARVRLHALEARDARGERREVAVRLARHALPGEHLEELVHREPARVARSALRRQDVIRPGRLVAERDRGLLAEAKRAVAREMREP